MLEKHIFISLYNYTSNISKCKYPILGKWDKTVFDFEEREDGILPYYDTHYDEIRIDGK